MLVPCDRCVQKIPHRSWPIQHRIESLPPLGISCPWTQRRCPRWTRAWCTGASTFWRRIRAGRGPPTGTRTWSRSRHPEEKFKVELTNNLKNYFWIPWVAPAFPWPAQSPPSWGCRQNDACTRISRRSVTCLTNYFFRKCKCPCCSSAAEVLRFGGGGRKCVYTAAADANKSFMEYGVNELNRKHHAV